MAAGRTEKDLQGVSLLGNKTKYRDDYAPDVLECFPNKHPENDYFVKFNFAQRLDNRILRRFTFRMFRIRNWLRANR